MKRGRRGTAPLIEAQYTMGHQAVLYSAAVIDNFRDFFAECASRMKNMLDVRLAKEDDQLAGDAAVRLCIEVSDNYNRRFVASKEKMTFFTTRDSLVQHIGRASAIQMAQGKLNQLFHYNVELGDVSEDYDDEDVQTQHRRI